MNNLAKILEPSHYQTFDLIEGDKRDSDSKGKFDHSRLATFDLVDKSILDIGCNAGYFLFKLIHKGAKSLVGIELGEKFVHVLNKLNQTVYKSPLIKAIQGDFFDHKFDQKFDLIICFSTFHYFKDNQLFFDKCFDLLNLGGTLLLEVEEYPENSLNLQSYYGGKYILSDKYKSVRQISHERWFYNLRKPLMSELPSIDKRPLVGEYKKTIIVLTGPSNIGKSTIADLLLNDNLDYISIDSACIRAELPQIQEFVKSAGKGLNFNLGLLFNFIMTNCPNQFIDYFFNKYIRDNKNSNIFVEGYVFMMTELYQLFIAKCKLLDYRIWNIRRIL